MHVRRPNRRGAPRYAARTAVLVVVVVISQRQCANPALFSMTMAQRVYLWYIRRTHLRAADPCRAPFVRDVSTDARVMAVINAIHASNRNTARRRAVTTGLFQNFRRRSRFRPRRRGISATQQDRIEFYIGAAWEKGRRESACTCTRYTAREFRVFLFSFSRLQILRSFRRTKMSRRFR